MYRGRWCNPFSTSWLPNQINQKLIFISLFYENFLIHRLEPFPRVQPVSIKGFARVGGSGNWYGLDAEISGLTAPKDTHDLSSSEPRPEETTKKSDRAMQQPNQHTNDTLGITLYWQRRLNVAIMHQATLRPKTSQVYFLVSFPKTHQGTSHQHGFMLEFEGKRLWISRSKVCKETRYVQKHQTDTTQQTARSGIR